MDEERQIARSNDEIGNGGIEGDNTSSDDLEISEEEARFIQRATGMIMGVGGFTENPLSRLFTSEHITQSLNQRENDSRRAHSSANFERWIAVWFGTAILAAAVGLIIFFGIRETYEVVTAIIGGLLGFAGGFGVGRMRR